MSIFNKVTKTFQWGQHSVTMETGEIARQSGGAVIVNIEDTVVLATVVASKSAKWICWFALTLQHVVWTLKMCRQCLTLISLSMLKTMCTALVALDALARKGSRSALCLRVTNVWWSI